MTSKYTAEQIFDSWFFYVRDNGDIRYIHKERPELVSDLADKFKKHGIDYDEASSYTKKVVNKLTTEEGRKGNGKYKGWKECVEEDYKAALAREYVDIPKENPIPAPNIQNSVNNIIPEDKWIVAWLDHKFGNNYPSDIKELAHTVGHSLNTQFLKDIFGSDWVKKSGCMPKWLENSCNM